MTRRDYPPGKGPAAGIVASVLLSGALIVVCGVVVWAIRSLS